MKFSDISKAVQMALLVAVVVLMFKHCNKVSYYKKRYDNEHDTLVSYINKDGLNESIISELELTKKDLKKELDTLKISNRTNTVTQVVTNTQFRVVTNTEVVHDTVNVFIPNSHLSPSMPTYKGEEKAFWYTIKTVANEDSIYTDVSFQNELLIKREQKRGLFKSKEIELTIIQQNPYTANEKVKAYNLKSKAPLFNASIQSGGGMDIITKKPTLYIGIGVGLNLIR